MRFAGIAVAIALVCISRCSALLNINQMQSSLDANFNLTVSGGNPLNFGYSVTIQNASDSSKWIWVGSQQHACACPVNTAAPQACNCFDTQRPKLGIRVYAQRGNVYVGAYDRSGGFFTYNANPGAWDENDFSTVQAEFFGGMQGAFLFGKAGTTVASGSPGYYSQPSSKWVGSNGRMAGTFYGYPYTAGTNTIGAQLFRPTGTANNEYLGWSVATGDVNGDGEFDVISGVPRRTQETGEVRVYFGTSTGGLNNVNSNIKLPSKQWGAMFGAVLLVLDINNDGYADVLVSAPTYDSLSAWETGSVFVYRGSSSGPSDGALCTAVPCASTVVQQLTGLSNGERFGYSLASLGDSDKDGFNDVAIGAPFYTNGDNEYAGRIFLYQGSSSGLQLSQTIVGEAADWRLGFSIAGGFDIDGDAYNDMVVGLPKLQRVGVFKAKTISEVSLSIITNPASGDALLASINATVCATINGPAAAENFLLVLTVDNRMTILGQSSSNATLSNVAVGDVSCVFFDVLVDTTTAKDPPLSLVATTINLTPGTQVVTSTSAVKGVPRCSGGACDVDLVLTGEPFPSELIAGNDLILQVNISALLGSSAFSLTLTLTWVDDLSLAGSIANVICLDHPTLSGVVCDVGDYTGSPIVFNMTLTTPERSGFVNPFATSLEFGTFELTTISVDTNMTNNLFPLAVPLNTESDLDVSMLVEPSVATIGPTTPITVTYTVRNPSATSNNVVTNIVLTFSWPVVSVPIYSIVATADEGTADCSSTDAFVDERVDPNYVPDEAEPTEAITDRRRRDVSSNSTLDLSTFPALNESFAGWMNLECTFSALERGQSFDIKVKAIINETLVTEDTVIELETNVTANIVLNPIYQDINLGNNHDNVTFLARTGGGDKSTVQGSSVPIEPWKIGASAAGAAFMVAALVGILYKAGAFRRKAKPPNLEELECEEDELPPTQSGPRIVDSDI